MHEGDILTPLEWGQIESRTQKVEWNYFPRQGIIFEQMEVWLRNNKASWYLTNGWGNCPRG